MSQITASITVPEFSEMAFCNVADELRKAIKKFPTWPNDQLHAMGVLNEEVGELNKSILQFVYEPHKTSYEEIVMEATQAAAMAIRFLISLENKEYYFVRCIQHEQG